MTAQAATSGPFKDSLNLIIPESKVPFFHPGFLGIVVINRCLWKTSDRMPAPAFIVEFTVESAAKMAPTDQTPPGSQRSWFQSMKEERTGWDSASLFLYAAMGLDPNSIECKTKVEPHRAAFLNSALEGKGSNSLRGERVQLETSLIKTKKQTDFTKYIFSVAPPKT